MTTEAKAAGDKTMGQAKELAGLGLQECKDKREGGSAQNDELSVLLHFFWILAICHLKLAELAKHLHKYEG